MLKAFADREEYYKNAAEDKPFSKIIGNNDWILWMQNAKALTSVSGLQYYKDELGLYERAIYGALCGNKEPLLEMSKTWHDRLWANLKTFFVSTVLKEFISERPNYSILFSGSFNPIALSAPVSLSFIDLLSFVSDSVILFILIRINIIAYK